MKSNGPDQLSAVLDPLLATQRGFVARPIGRIRHGRPHGAMMSNRPPAGTLDYNQARNQDGADVDEVEMRRDEVLRVLKSHTAELQHFGVKSLRLFGSVARDEAADGSDVDILVGFEKPPGFSSFMKLRIFLEDLLGAKVDLVTESGLRDRVRPYVEKEAIRVA